MARRVLCLYGFRSRLGNIGKERKAGLLFNLRHAHANGRRRLNIAVALLIHPKSDRLQFIGRTIRDAFAGRTGARAKQYLEIIRRDRTNFPVTIGRRRIGIGIIATGHHIKRVVTYLRTHLGFEIGPHILVEPVELRRHIGRIERLEIQLPRSRTVRRRELMSPVVTAPIGTGREVGLPGIIDLRIVLKIVGTVYRPLYTECSG